MTAIGLAHRPPDYVAEWADHDEGIEERDEDALRRIVDRKRSEALGAASATAPINGDPPVQDVPDDGWFAGEPMF